MWLRVGDAVAGITLSVYAAFWLIIVFAHLTTRDWLILWGAACFCWALVRITTGNNRGGAR